MRKNSNARPRPVRQDSASLAPRACHNVAKAKRAARLARKSATKTIR